MNLEEAINSDDVEIAKLAADILRQQKGKSYVGNLIKKNSKYEFRKGKGLVKVGDFKGFVNAFSQYKFVNTPLLDMTKTTTTFINGDSLDKITFTIPYELTGGNKE